MDTSPRGHFRGVTNAPVATARHCVQSPAICMEQATTVFPCLTCTSQFLVSDLQGKGVHVMGENVAINTEKQKPYV